MPSWFAASITVLPGATCVALPSISMLSCAIGGSHVRGHEAPLVIDVILEFVAVVLDERANRHCGGIAERADRAALDIVRNRVQQVEIFVAALAVLDPVDHAPQPAGAFATRRALAARLLEIEIRQPQQRL